MHLLLTCTEYINLQTQRVTHYQRNILKRRNKFRPIDFVLVETTPFSGSTISAAFTTATTPGIASSTTATPATTSGNSHDNTSHSIISRLIVDVV